MEIIDLTDRLNVCDANLANRLDWELDNQLMEMDYLFPDGCVVALELVGAEGVDFRLLMRSGCNHLGFATQKLAALQTYPDICTSSEALKKAAKSVRKMLEAGNFTSASQLKAQELLSAVANSSSISRKLHTWLCGELGISVDDGAFRVHINMDPSALGASHELRIAVSGAEEGWADTAFGMIVLRYFLQLTNARLAGDTLPNRNPLCRTLYNLVFSDFQL